MTMVGVWELCTLEDDPDKERRIFDVGARELLSQVGVHSVADNGEVGERDAILTI